MKELKYKEYQGIITNIDYRMGLMHGEVLLLKDVVTFKVSIDNYLAYCKDDGVEAARPLI